MSDLKNLSSCGCCEPPKDDLSHYNPPGQEQITYRIGTHSAFKRRMIRQLPKQQIPDGEYEDDRPLSALSTRADDDNSIALLDAWAMSADVLTFYQERIANEGFLRTATERLSVLELARAIGYELNPGVAASTHLAFTIDDSKGAPSKVEIPVGTQVQSLPAKKGELPQTFETSQDFVAHAKWNELRPLSSYIQSGLATRRTLYLAGNNAQIKAGDRLLVVESGSPNVRQVKESKLEKEVNQTKVVFTDGNDPASPVPTCATQGVPNIEGLPFSNTNIQTLVLNKTWTESNLQAFLKMNGWDGNELMDYVADQKVAGGDRVFAFGERIGFFGHNAPRWNSLPASQRHGGYVAKKKPDETIEYVFEVGPYPKPWDDPEATTIWTDSQKNDYEPIHGVHVLLEREISTLTEDGWVVFDGQVTGGGSEDALYKIKATSKVSPADYGISGKSTGLLLKLTNENNLPAWNTRIQFLARKTTAYLDSEELELAPLPIEDDLPDGAVEITLDGMVLGLHVDQPVALSGMQADAEGVTHNEILTLAQITHCGGYTTLKFNSGLSHKYLRSTVTLNANVIAATHGETVANEVLGGGNGTRKHQTFTLKKPPLTHIATATPGGTQSTLTVQVDKVKWQQASTLYGLDKNSRNFIVRIDDSANARIIFGDGKQGARLPTGQENVVATYRSGIGSAGEVDAGSLSLMKTRPFGAKSVTNPVDASGAANSETLGEARTNAPLTVLTMERIVSLRDYEDFARAFAGVGKAQAAVLWNGEKQVVHVTMADADGDVVTEASDLSKHLLEAMKTSRNPLEEVSLGSYLPLSFDLEANVLIDPDYTWENVKDEIEGELLQTFSFEKRAFGQAVTAAEVVSTIHRAAGVTAVDLEALHLTTSTDITTPASVLIAHLARLDSTNGTIQPAELILINENGIELTEMKTI